MMRVEETTQIGNQLVPSPILTLGIPSGRDLGWSETILSKLKKPQQEVEVLIARWIKKPLTEQDLTTLNSYFPTRVVFSQLGHAPAMRNAVIREAQSSHILFLDDDMVPGPDLLDNALQLAQRSPTVVHQGIPYRVANSHSRLAIIEGKLYERGYRKYIDEEDNVSLLDARLMLAPVAILRETQFDDSLVFGGGEGRALAKSLQEKGVLLRLGRDLDAAHINRDTLVALIAQKRAHGRGRGFQLHQSGPGEEGWLGYFIYYTKDIIWNLLWIELSVK